MSQQQEDRDLHPPNSVMEVVRDIAAEPGRDEAFFVYEVDEIIRKVDLWRKLLPRVDLFYAVKCNNYRRMLQDLASLGTGFDCASRGEIEDVISLGVDPSRIIFANPCKPGSHLSYAKNVDVALVTFDNISELHKIKTHHPCAELVLRIRYDAVISKVPLGSKYGAELKETRLLLKTASLLGLTVVGVCFHVGSGCGEPLAFHGAIAAARQVFDEAKNEGFRMHLLDIGGGFPGNDDVSMQTYARIINTALEMFFPDDGWVKVIGEPGRFVVTSAFTLASTVTSKREVLDNRGQLSSIMYYTNDGVYASFGFIVYEDEPPPPAVIKASGNRRGKVASTVWGQSCCSTDRIIAQAQLPILNCGDWLVWFNLGAYSLTLSTPFNGFPIPEVYVASTRRANERFRKHINPCKNTPPATKEEDVSAMKLKEIVID